MGKKTYWESLNFGGHLRPWKPKAPFKNPLAKEPPPGFGDPGGTFLPRRKG